MFSSIGTTELLIIVLVILLVFGGKQLPQVVRSIAKAWHDLQRTTQNVKDELRNIMDDEDDLKG
ncbi:MAG: twin-arginine translocase TatA/TatE family subunit [bacterium]